MRNLVFVLTIGAVAPLLPEGSRNMGLDPTNHRVYLVSAKFGEPPASGRGRRPVLPGTFSLLVIERAAAN
jgi:hypothetical protein